MVTNDDLKRLKEDLDQALERQANADEAKREALIPLQAAWETLQLWNKEHERRFRRTLPKLLKSADSKDERFKGYSDEYDRLFTEHKSLFSSHKVLGPAHSSARSRLKYANQALTAARAAAQAAIDQAEAELEATEETQS